MKDKISNYKDYDKIKRTRDKLNLVSAGRWQDSNSRMKDKISNYKDYDKIKRTRDKLKYHLK